MAYWCFEVLIAGGAPLSPAARPPDQRLGLTAAASALLHGLVLASLLLSLPRYPPPQSVQPLVVELIQSQEMTPGNVPAPPQPPPQDGTGPTAPTPPPPAVNIGNGPEQNDPLTVTGDNVVPPEPDARYRNLPPRYPADAARVGAEGTAQLVIRVSQRGLPIEVRVVSSSGNRSLDAEARRAVLLWRFRPAVRDGHQVEFDYPVNIRFAIGDHP